MTNTLESTHGGWRAGTQMMPMCAIIQLVLATCLHAAHSACSKASWPGLAGVQAPNSARLQASQAGQHISGSGSQLWTRQAISVMHVVVSDPTLRDLPSCARPRLVAPYAANRGVAVPLAPAPSMLKMMPPSRCFFIVCMACSSAARTVCAR